MSDLGGTGKFPFGKLNEDDEGELRAAVRHTAEGFVRIDFGKPVAWVTLPPAYAREFAKIILEHADKAEKAKQ